MKDGVFMDSFVYHGSSNGSILEFKPFKSTHNKKCIYATPILCAALLFTHHGNRDLDVRISTKNGILELVERREGILKSLYERPGYVYKLDASTFKHYDYLWSMEVISFEDSIKPIDKIYYENILKEIEKEEENGNIVIYRYPTRPSDVPLDNSDLIDKYIEYEKNGLDNATDLLLNIYPEFTPIVERKIKDEKERDKNN